MSPTSGLALLGRWVQVEFSGPPVFLRAVRDVEVDREGSGPSVQINGRQTGPAHDVPSHRAACNDYACDN